MSKLIRLVLKTLSVYASVGIGLGNATDVIPPPDDFPVAVITDDNGGRIIDYILRAAYYKEAKIQVEFAGRCDSSCTLYLSLPDEQLCITKDAFFRFHAPVDYWHRIDRGAVNLMMLKYPDWVQSWILSNNGLTRHLIEMDYSYAQQFMKTCAEPSTKA